MESPNKYSKVCVCDLYVCVCLPICISTLEKASDYSLHACDVTN